VGIERGLRIHEALTRLAGDLGTLAPASLAPNNLSKDEQAAVERFLSDPRVREILFRPGKALTEQHLSDTRSFGIVDRLIIAPTGSPSSTSRRGVSAILPTSTGPR